ncbi:MAG TPA: HD domain-containing protein, partial [Acidobacteria bacterium]|nr:HD domain-containing protein [Acidobacteriota bacterium]
EWDVMRQHVDIGVEICSPLRSLKPVLPIIRHHHERWDGSGYPDGLAGEEIPYLARVFQVVDVFDALTSDRCYRQALTTVEALDTLHQETFAKHWWDPEIVPRFAELVRREGVEALLAGPGESSDA